MKLRIKSRLRRFVPREVKAGVLEVVSQTPGVGRAYAQLASIFTGELNATLYGMAQHQREVASGRGSSVKNKLRRGVHRIEKGLIMRPRRGVFALDYIETTVGLYATLRGWPSLDEDDALLEAWAHDVLVSFFEAVEPHPILDAARAQFQAASADRGSGAGGHRPYQRDLETPLQVSYDGLVQLAYRRRSVRFFLPKKVPHELVDRALDVALQAPSACNRQPFEVRIYDEDEVLRPLAAIPMGTAGLHHNFPMILVWVGKLRAFSHHRDRHVPYIDASQAAMGFQFALESLGLSSCCINWPDIPSREKRVREVLNLEPDDRIVMFMAVGFPDPEAMVPFSQKKSLDEVRSYNRR